MKAFISRIKNDYVRNQVRKLKIGEFEDSSVKRYAITFSGRMQKVGFRLEVYELALRLSLTGFCRNLEDKDVYCELQGNENKIQFLVNFLKSLKRIKIRQMQMKEIPVIGEETFIRM